MLILLSPCTNTHSSLCSPSSSRCGASLFTTCSCTIRELIWVWGSVTEPPLFFRFLHIYQPLGSSYLIHPIYSWLRFWCILLRLHCISRLFRAISWRRRIHWSIGWSGKIMYTSSYRFRSHWHLLGYFLCCLCCISFTGREGTSISRSALRRDWTERLGETSTAMITSESIPV